MPYVCVVIPQPDGVEIAAPSPVEVDVGVVVIRAVGDCLILAG